MFSVTCVAPVNIALIKYSTHILGGKRNEDLILPINDSVSMTLRTDEDCQEKNSANRQPD
ncbi:diphosphomevalonate decarboxylase isoform X4 [Drosophila ananassae]|uniref:diphosphomevalonate decarboxylase isoform X4 n=1 Tax=Drosophila ananassae TaxID=7217 RepID=UPI001CFF92A0|nr:diphosphomevalonate decarboxylase isoform X4 [Drosophila ananassae]